MNIISYLASSNVPLPGGLWSSLINWFHSGIGNIGWTIVLVTLTIKLITSPLEFWTKLNAKKQALIQQKCAPQVAKIRKKFGANQDAVRIQTNALYKREGLNAGTGCVVTLVHLILSLVIFFTFFSSLRANSAYQAIEQYKTLENTFNEATFNALKDRNDRIEEFDTTTEDGQTAFVQMYSTGKDEYEKLQNNQTDSNVAKAESVDNTEESQTVDENSENQENAEEKTMTSEEYIAFYQKYEPLMNEVMAIYDKAVVDKWNEIKSKWLWVDNIWVSDAMTEPFLSYSGLEKIAKNGGAKYTNYLNETDENGIKNVDKAGYQYISNIINTKGGRKYNGYYLLALLAAGVTFLSQFISESHTKLKNKKAKTLANATADPMNMSMKWMKIIMPAIMIIFVLQSSASFGIYIVASNISSIAFGEVMNFFVNSITHKKQLEVEASLEKEADRMIKKGLLRENKNKNLLESQAKSESAQENNTIEQTTETNNSEESSIAEDNSTETQDINKNIGTKKSSYQQSSYKNTPPKKSNSSKNKNKKKNSNKKR